MRQGVKFAFIGGGNMAGSLVGGLIGHGCAPGQFRVADPDPSQRERLRKQFGIEALADNRAAAEAAEVIVLATKPQAAPEALRSLAPADDEALYLSVMAGVRESAIRRWLDTDGPVVRAMPNTPALLGCGITGMFAGDDVSDDQRELAESVMRAAGAVVWVAEERLLDPVTALSGSGPAYFFLLMEAMTEAGIEMGLAPEAARLLTQETALGAARMALESDAGVAELRRRVTSPGGTTAAAVEVLQSRGVPEALRAAVLTAGDRAAALAEEYGED